MLSYNIDSTFDITLCLVLPQLSFKESAMLRTIVSVILAVLAGLNAGCTITLSGGGYTSVNFPQRPQVDPDLLPVPSAAYSVIPPQSRVVDVQCATGSSSSSYHRGRSSGQGGRGCLVTFVTRQGRLCTTQTQESSSIGYGGSGSSRSASMPSCRVPTPDERKIWRIG